MNQNSNTTSMPLNIQTRAQERRKSQANCLESGLSPTYYTSDGMVQPNTKLSDAGSPVFNDRSRVFFSHNKECTCRGSGVGCDCMKTCSC